MSNVGGLPSPEVLLPSPIIIISLPPPTSRLVAVIDSSINTVAKARRALMLKPILKK